MTREPFTQRAKAVEFDFNGLLNPTGFDGLFCLSPATWRLSYNLVLGYGRWRSRYFITDIDTGQPLTIEDEEFDQVIDMVDIALQELTMPCDLGPTLEALGQMITELGQLTLQVSLNSGNNGNCGCPPGGIGDLPPDPAPDQNDPGGEDPPPDGFDTWEDYLDYKCRAANKIVDDLIASTGNLGSLSGVVGAIQAVLLASFLNTSLLGGVLAGVMALGFSEFAAAGIIIAALVALIVGSAGGLVWFSALANNMDENKEDLICALYIAQSVGAAQEAWSNFIIARIGDASGQWDGEPASGLISSTMETVLGALNNLTIINLLFQLDETIAAYEASFDCSACGTTHEFPWEFATNGGSGTFKYDGTSFTLSSQESGGVHTLQAFMQDVPNREDFNWCVQFVSRSTMNNTAANYTRQVYNNANDTSFYLLTQYDFSHTPPGVDAFPPLNQQLPISLFFFQNNAAFTVTMRFIKVVAAVDAPPHTSTACD